MRHNVFWGIVVCSILATPSFATNTVIAKDSAIFFLPFATSLPMPAADDAQMELNSEQMYTAIYRNADGLGDDDPEDCTVDWFLTNCNEATTVGLCLVDTHGNTGDGSIVMEVYRTELARNSAYTACQYMHWENYTNWEIRKANSLDGTWYGIEVHPRATASRSTMCRDALIIVCGCGSLNFMDEAWPGSACRAGHPSEPGVSADDAAGLIGRMCGAADKTLRSAAAAKAGNMQYAELSTVQFTSGSDAQITLAPVVESWSGPEVINYQLAEYDIVFDSKMKMEQNPMLAECVPGGGAFNVWFQRWPDDHTLHVEVSAYKKGPCALRIAARAVSAEGDKQLDGNTDPAQSDGSFPNQDDFDIQLTSNYEVDGSGGVYSGAYAFPTADSTTVSWVVDPEWSTVAYEVVDVVGNAIRRTVPPAGSLDRPHYYETNVANPDGHLLYVSNVDSSGAKRWTTPPLLTTSPPERLATLRQLNQIVESWPPYRGGGGRMAPDSLDQTAPRTLPPYAPDFLFYSSRQDFLDLAAPIGDWWFRNYRLRTGSILGGSTALDCREALRPYFERGQLDGKVPQVVILGEANQSIQPSWNIVGTHYFPQDEENGCSWGCASDNWIVDFDEDGVPDLPWSRVVAKSPEELGVEVGTALDWYRGDNVLAQRALVLGGTQRFFPPDCVVDELYTETLAEVASQLESQGIATVQMSDAPYGCDVAMSELQSAILPVFNDGSGIREIAGTGVISTRSFWPGGFIQKQYAPAFEMSMITRPQRLVWIMPGCDLADIDRNNPDAYPSLAKMFLANSPSGASAVAIIGHLRMGQAPYHPQVLRRIMDWRFSGATWTLQQAHLLALRDVATGGDAARAFVSVAGSLGWPVTLAGQATPSVPGGGAGGVGCPILDVWRGGAWHERNSVLSACAYRGGTQEAQDYVELAFDPTGASPMLQVRVRESEESEETILNRCQLRVLDYSASERRELSTHGRAIAVSQAVRCGQAKVQGEAFNPACLQAEDRDSLLILGGDRLEIVFPDSVKTTASGWIRIVGRAKTTIAPIGQHEGGLKVLGGGRHEYVFPRKNWQALVCDSINVVRGDGNPDTVVIESGETHWIDTVELLVGRVSNTGWTGIPLRTAVHSVDGDVQGQLAEADSQTVLVRSGESVLLTFYCGSLSPGEARRIVFEVTGRYQAAGNYRKVPSPADWSPRIWVSPNPCSHDALIVVEGVPESTGELLAEVFGADGRRVRSIGRWLSGSTFPAFRWDTRDEMGRRVPGGIYFVRIRQGDRVLTRKLVVLR